MGERLATMNKLVKWSLVVGALLTSGSYTPIAEAPQRCELPQLQAQPQHRVASRYITHYLTHYHYRPLSLDDQFSSKIFDRYVSLLDPQRNLLLLSDIQTFAAARYQLATDLSSGKLDSAYQLYMVVQQRRLERYRYALRVAQKPITWDTEEWFESDRSSSPWSTTVQQLDQLWARRVKFDALNLTLANQPESHISNLLTKRYQSAIKRLSQTNHEDVFFLLMNAFATAVDPHTRYLSPRLAAQFKVDLNLSMEGIGAGLQLIDDYVVVRSLVTGGPAAKSQAIAIDDRIIGVAQPGKPMVDIFGWRLDDVVELIRGPKGTQISLEILPSGGGGKSRQVILTRERIRLEDQAVKATTRSFERHKIGILTLPSFYIGLAKEVNHQLLTFEKQEVSAVLIDLRGNGGGSLDEVIALTGLFIPPGPVVQVRDRCGKITVYNSRYRTQPYTKPVLILVDRLSASASEIFAAALQDYGRALVVGDQTFGKGTVQQHQALIQTLIPTMQPLGHIQYTIQKFYRINGGSTQLKGVLPDLWILPGRKPVEIGESFADNALAWDSIPASTYRPLSDLSPYLAALRTQHQRRIAVNEEFTFLQQNLDDYQALKQRKGKISLNLKQRQQVLQQQEARLLAQANWRRRQQAQPLVKSLLDLPKDEKIVDPYLEEGLAMTLDWLCLLRQ
jgi:carboxyl-terminal processing protease